ncbi:uncharacterized protein LOC128721056 [Anopheles nili]|uniref:uncharacterized protein LOC128721056 n=1 Tax=Anopheles nili TaxID=185578 RepID=UPI00237A2E54|nr:uncharacterized protein LOC128721056 [Anopheles nili]
MSSNPCKHGDREKDQNNNFVNSTAHGGAGIDREARARRAAARAGFATHGGGVGEDHHHQQVLRSVGVRNQQTSLGGAPTTQRDAGTVGAGGVGTGGGPQVTAKVMWGSVSAIKELRDKEQNERQLGTRAAGRRQ